MIPEREEFVRVTALGVWHIRLDGIMRTYCMRPILSPIDRTPKYFTLTLPAEGTICKHCLNPKHIKENAMVTKAPTKSSVHNPSHYQFKVNGQPIQVVDIMEARFPEDMHLSQAVKYLLRAGHKTDETYTKDVGKCIWWCVKALMFNKVKHIELPPGAPLGERPLYKDK